MRDKLAIAMIIGFAAALGSAALAVGYMLAKLYSEPQSTCDSDHTHNLGYV
jgi:hypothetical protein